MKLIKILMTIQILIISIKSECTKGCLKCNDKDQCLYCDPINLYILESTTCNKRTLDNCQIIDLSGVCLVCENNYALDTSGKKCLKILEDVKIENCGVYQQIGQCLHCITGFIQKNGKCIASESKIENCLYIDNSDDTKCSICNQEFILSLDKKSCVSVNQIDKCASYSTLNCRQCSSGFMVDKNKYISDTFQFTTTEMKSFINKKILNNSIGNIDQYYFSQCKAINVTNCKKTLSYYQCEICDDKYYLNIFKQCVPFPKEVIQGCKIYKDAETCIECEKDQYLLSPQQCQVITEKGQCIEFDSKENQIKCLKCNNDFYLDDQSICKPRTDDSKFEDCKERNPREDKCQKCIDEKVLTGDKLKCLPIINNCLIYDESNNKTVQLTCKRCVDKWMYIKEQSKCVQGVIEFCDIYDLEQACQQCTQGYYLEDQKCLKQPEIVGCNSYSFEQKSYCQTCDFKSIKFDRNNGCLQAKQIDKCIAYSTINDCSECDIDYFLKENLCQKIVVPKNCRKLNKLNNDNCEICQKEYIINDSNFTCVVPQDYFLQECASNNIDGKVLLSNVKCNHCKENSIFMNYQHNFMCTSISSLVFNSIPTGCLKMKIVGDTYTCILCESQYVLQNNVCVTQCDEVNEVLLNYEIKYTDIQNANSKYSVNVYNTNICLTKTSYSQFALCKIGQPNLFQRSLTNNTTYENYTCVECQAGKFKIVQKEQYVITKDPNISPKGDSEINTFPGFKCINQANTLNQNQLNKITNCEYYYQNNSLITPITIDTYGCLRCKFGYYGVVNTNNYISSCEDMSSQCNKEYEMYQGISFNYSQLNILKTSWNSYFTCYKCINDSRIPFVALHNVNNDFPILGKNMQNMAQTQNVSIECKNPGLASEFNATGDVNFPQHCALGVYNSKYNTGFNTTGSTLKTPSDNQTAIYCIGCKQNYKPIYSDISTNDNYRNLVYSCVAMDNCENSIWFNACSNCKENHTYEYNTTSMLIDYSDCKIYDDPNCYAFFKNLQGVNECKFCKKGYTINMDGSCQLINAPKCTSQFMNYTVNYTFHYDQNIGLLFQLSQNGTGCNKCFQDYIAVYESQEKYYCTYQEYIQKKIYVQNSKLINNCKNYSEKNGDIICLICDINYIPSTDGKCYLGQSQQNCLQLKGSINCNQCQSDYVIIDGTCKKKAIENCLVYENDSTSVKQLCAQCQPEHYRITDKTQCLKGKVSNCEIMESEKICQQCLKEFFIVKLKDNLDYCYPLDKSLNCQKIDEQQLKQNNIIKCNQCNFGYTISIEDGEFFKTICMEFIPTDKCIKYHYVNNNLQESSLQCLQCKENQFLTDEYLCQDRKNTIANCVVKDLYKDSCQKCTDGNYVSVDGLSCIEYPKGIKGCIEYKSSTNCFKCDKNFFLNENQCFQVDKDNLKDNCLYYNNDQTCFSCESGYAVENNNCVLAQAQNCLEYSSKIACSACYPNFGFKKVNSIQHCVNKNVANCKESEDFYPFKCLICENFYYPDDKGNCLEVTSSITNCVQYDQQQKCQKCTDKGVLSLDKTSCLTDNFLSLISDQRCIDSVIQNPICSTCQAGYYLNSLTQCEKCSGQSIENGCYACDPTNQSICMICAPGFYQNKSGDCVTSNGGNSTTDNNNNGDDDNEVVTPLSITIYVLKIYLLLLWL